MTQRLILLPQHRQELTVDVTRLDARYASVVRARATDHALATQWYKGWLCYDTYREFLAQEGYRDEPMLVGWMSDVGQIMRVPLVMLGLLLITGDQP